MAIADAPTTPASMSMPVPRLLSTKEEALLLRATPKGVKVSKYKTELCTKFLANGSCPYGNKCQFAHGEHELRNRDRHDRYKTRVCKRFVDEGFCPYAHRCVFVHPGESGSAVPQHAKAVDGRSQPVIADPAPEPEPAARAAKGAAARRSRGGRGRTPMSAPMPGVAECLPCAPECPPCAPEWCADDIDARNDETFGSSSLTLENLQKLDLSELAGRTLEAAAAFPVGLGRAAAEAAELDTSVPTLHSRGRADTSFSQLMREVEEEREQILLAPETPARFRTSARKPAPEAKLQTSPISTWTDNSMFMHLHEHMTALTI